MTDDPIDDALDSPRGLGEQIGARHGLRLDEARPFRLHRIDPTAGSPLDQTRTARRAWLQPAVAAGLAATLAASLVALPLVGGPGRIGATGQAGTLRPEVEGDGVQVAVRPSDGEEGQTTSEASEAAVPEGVTGTTAAPSAVGGATEGEETATVPPAPEPPETAPLPPAPEEIAVERTAPPAAQPSPPPGTPFAPPDEDVRDDTPPSSPGDPRGDPEPPDDRTDEDDADDTETLGDGRESVGEAEPPVAGERTAEEPVAGERTAEEPPAEEPPAEEPPAEEPPAEEPPAEEPPAEEPPAEEPPAEEGDPTTLPPAKEGEAAVDIVSAESPAPTGP